MADFKQRIDELAQLMDEFHLAEARLQSDGLTVAFRRRSPLRNSTSPTEAPVDEPIRADVPPISAAPTQERIAGTAIPSPMAGIFYDAPSPGSPPFVREGDTVSAGQIIGLIEAMKVFNEIPSPISGTVTRVVAEGGNLLQPGDPIIIVE